jgi:hypothetical protein
MPQVNYLVRLVTMKMAGSCEKKDKVHPAYFRQKLITYGHILEWGGSDG